MPRLYLPASGGGAYPEWKAGRYYAPPTTGVLTGSAGVDFQIAGAPFLVPASGGTIDQLIFECTTAGTGSTARGVLYNDDGGYPGTLLHDPGTGAAVSCATTGVKTISTSATLPAGMVWAMLLVSSTAGNRPGFRRVNGGFHPVGALTATNAANAILGGYYDTSLASATAPATFTASATHEDQAWRVAVRAA